MKENSNNYTDKIRVVETLEQMKIEAGEDFSLAAVNLAELERRTGISRAKLRRLKENGFVFKPHGSKGRSAERTVLTGYTGALDDMLRNGITNSSVCLERLQQIGYSGSLTVVKTYSSSAVSICPCSYQTWITDGIMPDRIEMRKSASIGRTRHWRKNRPFQAAPRSC